ncbi:GNAT family N-acetyltransferase [Streptomyces sp. NPDC003077]|uniref:GNAT family N-acetyltransferase n=1 Tax=Streptomyces sp. NPDC003077 TaxID=3154443 RepID=UPI00339EEC4D
MVTKAVGLDAAGANAGPGPWDADLADVAAHYPPDRGDFVVGSVGGFLVAMGALRPAADGAGEIKRMRVHPRWQGRGFGRLVLAHLERRAVELGYRRLVLDTTEGQHAALALYRRHGYRRIGEATVAEWACRPCSSRSGCEALDARHSSRSNGEALGTRREATVKRSTLVAKQR